MIPKAWLAYTGSNGGAIVFDGTNDYCITSYTNNSTYFTFECILKVNDTSGIKVFTGKYSGTGDNYWLGMYNDSKFTFSTNGTLLNSGITISTSQIYIVNCIIGESLKEIYVNGTQKNSSSTFLLAPNGGLALATFGTSLGFYSNINIYNFKFYNRTLSATEILQNYNAQKSRFGL